MCPILDGYGVIGIFNTRKKSPMTPGIDPETVRVVAQCLNHYATLGPEKYYIIC
jgi:hypothetical protein